MFENAKVIYAYTRENALADGVLTDASKIAKEAGFNVPVCITCGIRELCNPKDIPGQDYEGRLWDVIWMSSIKVRTMIKKEEMSGNFEVYFKEKEGLVKKKLLVCFTRSEGFTIMLPHEY